MNWKKAVGGALLLGLCCLGWGTFAASSELQELQSKLQALNRRRRSIEDELIQAQETLGRAKDDLTYLQDEILSFYQQQVRYQEEAKIYREKADELNKKQALKIAGIRGEEERLRALNETETSELYLYVHTRKQALDKDKKDLEERLKYLKERTAKGQEELDKRQKEYDDLIAEKGQVNKDYIETKYAYERLRRQEGETYVQDID